MSSYDTTWNLLDIAWMCVSRAQSLCEDEQRSDAQAMARISDALQDAKRERRRVLKAARQQAGRGVAR